MDQRYARHYGLDEIGESGQEKLADARVFMAGVGGLGSPVALYLAAAGVGHLGLADADRVDRSNLQRQILYAESDQAQIKVESAKTRLLGLNSSLSVATHNLRLDAQNAETLLAGYDLVIDGLDNMAGRLALFNACHALKIPYIHAGILAFVGQLMTVIPGETCCWGCLFGEAGEPEKPQGPIGTLPGVIGTLQATEAIKWIVGAGELLTDRLLHYDALAMRFREIAVARNSHCPICGADRV